MLCSPNGSRSFAHTFSQTLLYKWYVKNRFGFAIQFFLLLSDSLGGEVYVFQFLVNEAGTSKIGLPP